MDNNSGEPTANDTDSDATMGPHGESWKPSMTFGIAFVCGLAVIAAVLVICVIAPASPLSRVMAYMLVSWAYLLLQAILAESIADKFTGDPKTVRAMATAIRASATIQAVGVLWFGSMNG